MTKRSSFLRWFLPAAVVFAAGFACAAMWDLPLAQALYSPHNPVAVVMEAIGWFPAFLPVVFYALLLATRPGGGVRQRVGGYGVAFAGLAVMYWKAWDYLIGREALPLGWDGRTLLWLALGMGLAAMLLVLALRLPSVLRPRLTFWARWGSIFMAANQVVVYAVKLLWQRTRFDTMVLDGLGNFDAFTPWWHPFGNGGTSFPSGHTANAVGILVLVLLCDLLPAWNRRRKLVYVGCWAYIAFMAFERMLIGRHFLSDTLVAAALMGLVFFALRHNRRYTDGLRELKQEFPLPVNRPGGTETLQTTNGDT